MALLSYDELLRTLPGGERHLLVGNGSSISVHAAFAYRELWPLVRMELGGCEALTEFMDRCETPDVENALRGILHGNTIDPGTDPEDAETLRKEHYQMFQEAFIRAVAGVHPEFPNQIDANMWGSFRGFLADYHHVFTLNYDLLLYWLNARAPPAERWVDGFFPAPDGRLAFSGRLVLRDRPSMVFLHGALHFYQDGEEIYKHAWEERGRGIIVQLREALARQQLPLFVSEGTFEHKGAKIAGHPYLSACLNLIKSVSGTLVTFGASFSESDRHIARAIALNPNLRTVAIGVYKSNQFEHGQKLVESIAEARRQGGLPDLAFHFYDTSTVKPWGEHGRVVKRAPWVPRNPVAYVDVNDPYEDARAAKWEVQPRQHWSEQQDGWKE